MIKTKKLNNRGFTLVELLMVILIIGILAAVGITQFVNFNKDARETAIKANLQILRKGIAAQTAILGIRCHHLNSAPVTLAEVQANDVTTDTAAGPPVVGCTTVDIPMVSERQIVGGSLPVNPWGTVGVSTVVLAPGTGTGPGTVCSVANDGWCYDPTTGNIWANSTNNTGDGTTGTEATY